MAKLLLFIAVLAVVYVLVRASNRRSKPPSAPSVPEAMTQCAHCGVHFPHSESVREAGDDFCCEDHRRLGAKP